MERALIWERLICAPWDDACDEARADRVEIVSGRREQEVLKEMNASGLPKMFKTFRNIFANELTERFKSWTQHLISTSCLP